MVVPAATSMEVMLSKMACFVDFSMCSNSKLFSVALSAAQHSVKSDNVKQCMRNIASAAVVAHQLHLQHTCLLMPCELVLYMHHSLTASARLFYDSVEASEVHKVKLRCVNYLSCSDVH